jgi:hypothetical protein
MGSWISNRLSGLVSGASELGRGSPARMHYEVVGCGMCRLTKASLAL